MNTQLKDSRSCFVVRAVVVPDDVHAGDVHAHSAGGLEAVDGAVEVSGRRRRVAYSRAMVQTRIVASGATPACSVSTSGSEAMHRWMAIGVLYSHQVIRAQVQRFLVLRTYHTILL